MAKKLLNTQEDFKNWAAQQFGNQAAPATGAASANTGAGQTQAQQEQAVRNEALERLKGESQMESPEDLEKAIDSHIKDQLFPGMGDSDKSVLEQIAENAFQAFPSAMRALRAQIGGIFGGNGGQQEQKPGTKFTFAGGNKAGASLPEGPREYTGDEVNDAVKHIDELLGDKNLSWEDKIALQSDRNILTDYAGGVVQHDAANNESVGAVIGRWGSRKAPETETEAEEQTGFKYGSSLAADKKRLEALKAEREALISGDWSKGWLAASEMREADFQRLREIGPQINQLEQQVAEKEQDEEARRESARVNAMTDVERFLEGRMSQEEFNQLPESDRNEVMAMYHVYGEDGAQQVLNRLNEEKQVYTAMGLTAQEFSDLRPELREEALRTWKEDASHAGFYSMLAREDWSYGSDVFKPGSKSAAADQMVLADRDAKKRQEEGDKLAADMEEERLRERYESMTPKDAAEAVRKIDEQLAAIRDPEREQAMAWIPLASAYTPSTRANIEKLTQARDALELFANGETDFDGMAVADLIDQADAVIGDAKTSEAALRKKTAELEAERDKYKAGTPEWKEAQAKVVEAERLAEEAYRVENPAAYFMNNDLIRYRDAAISAGAPAMENMVGMYLKTPVDMAYIAQDLWDFTLGQIKQDRIDKDGNIRYGVPDVIRATTGYKSATDNPVINALKTASDTFLKKAEIDNKRSVAEWTDLMVEQGVKKEDAQRYADLVITKGLTSAGASLGFMLPGMKFRGPVNPSNLASVIKSPQYWMMAAQTAGAGMREDHELLGDDYTVFDMAANFINGIVGSAIELWDPLDIDIFRVMGRKLNLPEFVNSAVSSGLGESGEEITQEGVERGTKVGADVLSGRKPRYDPTLSVENLTKSGTLFSLADYGDIGLNTFISTQGINLMNAVGTRAAYATQNPYKAAVLATLDGTATEEQKDLAGRVAVAAAAVDAVAEQQEQKANGGAPTEQQQHDAFEEGLTGQGAPEDTQPAVNPIQVLDEQRRAGRVKKPAGAADALRGAAEDAQKGKFLPAEQVQQIVEEQSGDKAGEKPGLPELPENDRDQYDREETNQQLQDLQTEAERTGGAQVTRDQKPQPTTTWRDEQKKKLKENPEPVPVPARPEMREAEQKAPETMERPEAPERLIRPMDASGTGEAMDALVTAAQARTGNEFLSPEEVQAAVAAAQGGMEQTAQAEEETGKAAEKAAGAQAEVDQDEKLDTEVNEPQQGEQESDRLDTDVTQPEEKAAESDRLDTDVNEPREETDKLDTDVTEPRAEDQESDRLDTNVTDVPQGEAPEDQDAKLDTETSQAQEQAQADQNEKLETETGEPPEEKEQESEGAKLETETNQAQEQAQADGDAKLNTEINEVGTSSGAQGTTATVRDEGGSSRSGGGVSVTNRVQTSGQTVQLERTKADLQYDSDGIELYSSREKTAQLLNQAQGLSDDMRKAGAHFASWSGGTQMDETTRQQVQVIDYAAKQMGVSAVFDSEVGGGKANGSYAWTDENGHKVIHIAQNAKNPLQVVFSHEMLHLLAANNSQAYQDLKSAFIRYADNAGLDVGALVKAKMDLYERHGVQLNGVDEETGYNADALEEVIADALYDVIGDERAAKALAAKNPGLVQRIQNWIRETLDKIHRMLDHYADNTPQAKMLRDQEGALEELRKIMNDALTETRPIREEKARVANVGSNGELTDKFQEKIREAEGREEMNKAASELADGILRGQGLEASLGNRQRLYTAAGDFMLSGGTISEAMELFDLKWTAGTVEQNRAFAALGKYVQGLMERNDVEGFQGLMEEETEENSTTKYQISSYERNGKKYYFVQADRQVITGSNPEDWEEQTRTYIHEQIRKGKDVTFVSENGTRLTITEDTEGKATFRNTYPGSKEEYSDDDYALKLRIENHIDEVGKVSVGKGTIEPDHGNHPFAKDGFTYRKAYFQDFDGKYYSLTISVGKNGKINTIYNVNQIKEASLPSELKGSALANASATNNASKGSKPQSSGNVKKSFSISDAEAAGESTLPNTLTEVYEQQHQADEEIRKNQKALKDYENSPEMRELLEKLRNAKGIKAHGPIIEEMKALEEKAGVAQIKDEIERLKERKKALNRREEEIRRNDLMKKVQDSGKSTEDYFRDAAVKEFGYTSYFYDAGYILPNGKMLNFSGEKGKHFGMRGQDHRAIGTIYEGTMGQTAGMNAFINDGNIRIMDEGPGIDLSISRALTDEQEATVRRHILRSGSRGYHVDFTGPDGRTVQTLDYQPGTKAEKILSDIAQTVRQGSAPEQSITAQFHTMYSFMDQQGDDTQQGRTAAEAEDEWNLYSDVAGTDDNAYQLINNLIALRTRETENADGRIEHKTGAWKGQIAKQVETIAQQYGNGNKGYVERKLRALYNEMDGMATEYGARSFVDESLRAARTAVREIYGSQEENQKRDDLKAFFGGRTIYLDKMVLDDAKMGEGGVKGLRSRFATVNLKVTTKAKEGAFHLESEWEEAARRFGLDPDISNPADQLMELDEMISNVSEYGGVKRALTADEDRILDLAALDLVSGWIMAGSTPVVQRTVTHIDQEHQQKALDRIDELETQVSEQADTIESQAQELADEKAKTRTVLDQLFKRAHELEELKRSGANRAELDEARKAYAELANEHAETVKQNKSLERKLEKARERHRELHRELSEARKAEKEAESKAEKLQQRVEKQKARLEEKLNNQKQKLQEARAKGQEYARRYKAQEDIRKQGTKIQRMIVHPKPESYVPADMMRTVSEFINEFLKTTKRGNLTKTGARLQQFIQEMRESPEYNTANVFDDRIVSMINQVNQLLDDDVPLSKMTTDSLQLIANALKSIVHNIEFADQTIGMEKNREIQAEATEGIQVMDANPRVMDGKKGPIYKAILSHLNPQRVFRAMAGYKENAISRLADMMSGGQRTQEKVQMNMTKKFEHLWGKGNEENYLRFIGKGNKKKGGDGWNDTGIDRLNSRGEKVGTYNIIGAQKVSLALHWLNEQNKEGMRVSKGADLFQVTMPDEILYKKGEYKEAYARGTTMYFTEAQGQALIDSMTDYERQWVKAWQDCQAYVQPLINETSMLLKGYRLATLQNYFPIHRDTSYIAADFESVVMDQSMENKDFTHQRVNSHKPMLLEDVVAVIEHQIKGNSDYIGLAIPVRNFNKIYNATMPGYADSFKKAVFRTQGKAGADYIEKMMSDIQGGQRREKSFLDSMRSRYAGAVLGLNPSVTIKQAASFPTAAATLGWKPIMKAMAMIPQLKKIDLDMIDKYTAAHWLRRSQSFTDAEGNAQIRSGFQRAGHKFFNSIQEMDIATTRLLWVAAEFAVQENSPNLKKGSEEYYQEVGRMYDRALEETQPEHGVWQTPQVLRSKNEAVRMLTMFKTQSFQNFGIMFDAGNEMIQAAKAAKRESTKENQEWLQSSKKRFALAASSQVVSGVVLAVMTMIGKALYHSMDPYRDEKGDITPESAGTQILRDTVGSWMGMFSGGSELYELVLGLIDGQSPYDIEAAGISTLNDLYQNVFGFLNKASVLADSDMSAQEKWDKFGPAVRKLANSISEMFGIPMNNALKLIDGTATNALEIANGVGGSFQEKSALGRLGWLGVLLGASRGRDVSNTKVAPYIAGAMADGDQAEAVRLYNEQLRQGKSGQAVSTAIKTQQKAIFRGEIQAAAEAIESGDVTTYNNLINQMTKGGVNMANAVSWVETERKKIGKAGAEENNESAKESAPIKLTYDEIMESLLPANAKSEQYTTGMLTSLQESGNLAEAQKVYKKLLETREASSIQSSMTSYWKPQLVAAYNRGDMTEVKRIKAMLMQFGYKEKTISNWTKKKKTSK